jgi:hypothetical protein
MQQIDRPTVQSLADAGASGELIAVVTAETGDVLGCSRNSARQHIQRRGGSPDDLTATGGDFFTALWEGDLFDAWCLADINNSRLLLDVFGPRAIIGSGVADEGQPVDYVTRMVREGVEQHAPVHVERLPFDAEP